MLFNVSFKACVSLLTFCLDDLASVESGILKSPTIIVLLSISSFSYVNICFKYLDASVFVAYKFIIVLCTLNELTPSSLHTVIFFVSCHWFWLKVYFILCKYNHSSLLLITVCKEHLLYVFIFNLSVSLKLKWFFCRQHTVGSCGGFLIHSAILCLLIGEFSPFTFKIIIGIVLIDI